MVNSPKPKVAIFGGSFDPPHKGHQEIVKKAIAHLEIETLLVVPAYLNPFKKVSLASTAQRLSWTKVLFESMPNVTVSSYEIEQGQATFTSDTVKYFQQRYDVKYLIIGADNLAHLEKWHNFMYLNQCIIWVIATRGTEALKTKNLNKFIVLEIDVPISSSHIREHRSLESIDNKIKLSVQDILEGQNK